MSDPPPPGWTPPPPPPPPGASRPPPPAQPPPPAWNAERPLLPSQPQTLGDVLDGAFRLLGATMLPVATLVLLILGPFYLLQGVAQERLLSTLGVNAFGVPTDPTTPPEAFLGPDGLAGLVGGLLALAAVGMVVGLIVRPLVSGAVTWMAAERGRGRDVTWRTGLQAAWGRLGSLIGAGILVTLIAIGLALAALLALFLLAFLGGQVHEVVAVLITVLGLLAAIPFAIAFYAFTQLTVPAIILEGRTATRSLGRAWQLLRLRFWPITGMTTVVLLIIVIAGSVLGLLVSAIAAIAGPLSWLITGIGSTAVAAVTVPLLANAILLVYLDVRLRREGYGLRLPTSPPSP